MNIDVTNLSDDTENIYNFLKKEDTLSDVHTNTDVQEYVIDLDTEKTSTDTIEDCGICGSPLCDNVVDINMRKVKISCNHIFHYKCILLWWKDITKKYKKCNQTKINKRECPYCRQICDHLPLYGKVIHKHIHKEYKEKKLPINKNVIVGNIKLESWRCQAIVKTGKKQCSNSKKYGNFCGIHKLKNI